MPRVRIESSIPRDRESARRIMSDVMDALIEVLLLAEDDRTVSYTAFEKGLFLMKPPYTLFIEILLFAGRSDQTKKLLYRTIIDRLHGRQGIGKEEVMIVLNEQPRANWGLRGGVPADMISFDYPIDI